MGRDRYHVISKTPHFLTCTVIHWLSAFTDPKIAAIIFDSLKFLQEQDRLELYGYVLMENHLHLIASSPDLAKEIGDFKSYTARQIVDRLRAGGNQSFLDQLSFYKAAHKTDRDFQFWEEGYHPEMITDDKMLRVKLDYMHYNPVRRGYVDNPTHWRYSSARNYGGIEGILPLKGMRGK